MFKPTWNSRYEVSSCGEIRNVKSGRILKQVLLKGYRRVTFSDGSKRQNVLVHAAVLFAFVGPRPAGAEINHLDGNKQNNLLKNLEYASAKENRRHALANGLAPRHANRKLTDKQIRYIKRRLVSPARPSLSQIARDVGVSVATIYYIRNGRLWANVL